MAGSLLSTLLGKLKSFLSTMASPIQGLNMDDVKVKDDGSGRFSALFAYSGSDALKDIHNQDINLNVLITATNVLEVFKPILDALNALKNPEETGSSEEVNTVLDILLGKDRPDNQVHENNGLGLLGWDLTKKLYSKGDINYKNVTWDWAFIANKNLQYAIECEAPGKDYGAIENQNLTSCGSLVSEYLVKVGLIDNANEITVDNVALITPILLRVQAWLINYYNDAVEKYTKSEDTEEPEDSNSDETEDTTDNTSEDTSNPEGDSGTGEESNEGDGTVKESTQIKVKLQKVMGSSQIGLLGLETNGTPADTLNYIDDIINQDDFINVITEEPQTFAIDVGEDGYEIEQCEDCEFDPCKSLEEVFKSGIRAYRNLYTLHWMANGNDMMKLHNLTEDMYKELIDEIDVVGELLVEKCGTVPALDFPCDYIPVQQYDFQTGLDQIKSLIQVYIDCIDCAYPNQTSDVQSTLDEWLRYWNKQLNYFVKRQEV